MGYGELNVYNRSNPYSTYPPIFAADSGFTQPPSNPFVDDLKRMLGLDPNDTFERGPRSLGMEPRMMAELLIGLALMMHDQKNAGGAPRSMPSQNWSGGGQVPGGWSNAPASTSNAPGPTSNAPSPTSNAPSTATSTATPQPYKGGKELVPQQFGSGLTGIQESSGCGPLAAIGVARAFGKDPDIQQTFNLASQTGWGSAGMGGPANYQRLLEKMGIPAQLDSSVNAQKIKDSIAAGKPVTLSTAQHYFLASDYDPQTGKFFVGNSGTAMKAGNKWMSLDEIAALGNGINGVIYAG